jgi:transposase
MGKKRGGGVSIMREKVIEIIRLKELGISITEIARSCCVHRQTARHYIHKAKAAGLGSEEISKLEEQEFRRLLQPGKPGRKIKENNLDFLYFHKEKNIRGVTLLLLWEEYLREHPDGYSYSQFCQKYMDWTRSTEVSMRQVHKAGEKVFVDYSGMKVPIYDRNEPTKVLFDAEIFVGAMGFSNYIFCEATRSQEIKHWIGSHVRMFEYFGGVPAAVVPDNLKSGVTKANYFEPGINKTYQDFAEHYDVAILPTRTRKPKDKSKVENGVQNVQRRILAKLRNRKFFSISELNAAIKIHLEELNARLMKQYGKSRKELFLEVDFPALRSLPKHPYVLAVWKNAKVSIDYHIEVDRHYYSVPYEYVRKEVDIKITEKTIEIFLSGKRIALHQRSEKPYHHTTIKEHMPANHRFLQEWTPMRFLEWADKFGPETKIQINSILLSRKHLEQSYRSCLGVLSLGKKYGKFKLEQACTVANGFGAVSVKTIKNIIKNNQGVKSAEPEDRPVIHSNIRGDTEFH